MAGVVLITIDRRSLHLLIKSDRFTVNSLTEWPQEQNSMLPLPKFFLNFFKIKILWSADEITKLDQLEPIDTLLGVIMANNDATYKIKLNEGKS